jgi:UDP-N-acetylmuramate--alanine ligase
VLGRTRRIHFVGIGGIGMSGIAELVTNLGYEVSGSDAKASDLTARLEKLGVRIAKGHDAAHVRDADVVVTSSAIQAGNAEVEEARRRRIPVIPRAEMLAELMRLRYGIAVAGAHGKTTTTSMIALVLERAGLDPTAVIGGRLSAFGSNARLGRGDYMVVEADESDRSFLKLTPSIAVITNIDREHMESYGSWEALQEAFVEFANKVPFYGTVVACADDEPVRALLPRMTRRAITYGFDDRDATVTGHDMTLEAFGARCRVVHTPSGAAAKELGVLQLRVPGRHNLLNALGAVAVGLEVGIPFAKIASGFTDFRGAERRFQMCGEARGVMVVDDYGHHPTEIAAVIAAARAGLDRRVVVVFQPHRYTRTRDLLDQFGVALGAADEIVLTDVYAAGETPIPGATAEAVEAVVRTSGRPVTLIKALDDIPAAVARISRPNDLVITLGAGSVGTLPDRILDALRGESGTGGEGGTRRAEAGRGPAEGGGEGG